MFFVGAQGAHWLDRATLPVMLSYARLVERAAPLPTSNVPWFLDSGVFTSRPDRLNTPTWAWTAQRLAAEAGSLVAVSTLDWLCTPSALAHSGLSVEQAQQRTCRSFVELRETASELPWVPTLQGWTADDYSRHVEMYERSWRVQLDVEHLVGVGSIAVRQHTSTARSIIEAIRRAGVERLHVFGAKRSGLAAWGASVSSADSMAWSYAARRGEGHCGGPHRDCRNCQAFAELWAAYTARFVGEGHEQLALL